jgi:hypothetical protein
MVIYEAFVEGKFEAPKHLARTVNDSTLAEVRGIPTADDLESLQRVHFGLQEPDPFPQFKATAKLGEFLERKFSVLLTERHSPEDRESDPSTRAFELVECAE